MYFNIITLFLRLPYNQAKNRYFDVVPADSTRFSLQSVDQVPGSDYINANNIKVCSCCKDYIATQGPLPNTVNDFWKMVWESLSEMIVMTTNIFEGGRKRSEK